VAARDLLFDPSMKKSQLKLERTTGPTIVRCGVHSNGGPAVCYTDACQLDP
jgi:hypothetical protein